MEITNLKLINYRNYVNLDIDFSKTLNIIYGNNGSGKSNIIEAIYMLALTKSFRTNNDLNLIRKDCDNLSIKGSIYTNTSTKYELSLNCDGKKVFIDSDRVNKLSDYVTCINVVIFNPLDTRIISDSPGFRRKMLNIEISQFNKDYLLLLNDYNKILKNRNAYLKQMFINGNSSKDYLDILTQKLIDIGLKISNIRKDYVNLINNNISNIYKNIFEYGELKIEYKSSYLNKSVDKLLELYRKNYKKEMAFGKTLIGIHHDDIELLLDNNPIKEFGSVGQQKNAIISYKLSQLLIIKEKKGYYPILILDDLFSELDKEKVNNIIKMLNKEVQTFITTTNIDYVNHELLTDSSIFYVDNGRVIREDKNE